MSVIEKVVRLFAPHRCVGCGVEEDCLLCQDCAQSLPRLASRCYRCLRATDAHMVCAGCRPLVPLRRVVPITAYKGPAKELVHRLKYERAQSGIREVARLLADSANIFSPDALLVYIPTATSRVRARGYDHAALLCREVSRITGLPRRRLLARSGQAHQVGSSRVRRLEQLQDTFWPVDPKAVRGAHIILVDDVLTTGATLETAAQVLRWYGAAQVDALVFAQA